MLLTTHFCWQNTGSILFVYAELLNMSNQARLRGFTLIELMITMVIIAILAAIALPSYESYVIKQKIKAAQADLVALSLNMENSYQQQLTYPAVTANTAATKVLLPGWNPAMSSDFSYLIQASSTSSYTLQATGTSTKLSGCTIGITSANVRSISSCYGNPSSWY